MRCVLLLSFFFSQVCFANQNFNELETKDEVSIGVESNILNSNSELPCKYKDGTVVYVIFGLSATIWTVSAIVGASCIARNAYHHIENWKQQEKALEGAGNA